LGWTSPGALATATGDIKIAASKAENSVAVGAELIALVATPTGTGGVTYALLSSTDSVGVLAADKINVDTGKALNYEIASEYIFVVTYVIFLHARPNKILYCERVLCCTHIYLNKFDLSNSHTENCTLQDAFES